MSIPSTRRAALSASAFEVLPVEAAVVDCDGAVVLVNEAWREFGRRNGAGAACGVGADYLGVCRAAAAAGDALAGVVAEALTAVLEGHAPEAALDYPCHSPTEQRWFSLRARAMPRQRRMLVVHDDVTRRVRDSTQLAHDATHDPLTGLPNRALLLERLAAALSPADRSQASTAAVAVVDVDRFQDVNHAYGRLAGDAVLSVLAGRFAGLLRAGDTVARWGGDEYVLVLPGCLPSTARQVLQRLHEAAAVPVPLGVAEVRVSVSTGLAMARRGQDPVDLLAEADAALLRDKARGTAGGEPPRLSPRPGSRSR